MDINQLLTAKEAAALKGFNSRTAFIYHVKCSPETPQPRKYHGILLWVKSEIEQWEPRHQTGPIKKTRKEVKDNGKDKRSNSVDS